jgi:hypothetical protein
MHFYLIKKKLNEISISKHMTTITQKNMEHNKLLKLFFSLRCLLHAVATASAIYSTFAYQVPQQYKYFFYYF